MAGELLYFLHRHFRVAVVISLLGGVATVAYWLSQTLHA